MNTIYSKEIDENVLLLPNTVAKDYIKLDTIVRCEEQKDCSIIYLNNGNKHIVSKTLKSIAKKLPPHMFIKVQPLHIVNLAFINRYIEATEDYLIMHDGTKILLSNTYKKTIKNLLKTV
jgi:two-component system, LytTR family, response regulator